MRVLVPFAFGLALTGPLRAQPTLRQLAAQRAQTFHDDSLRFYSSLGSKDAEFDFSRYSPRGVPLFLRPLNLQSARATGTDVVNSGQGGILLRGEGMHMAAWDDGLVAPHRELGNRIISTEGTQPRAHATHVAGTLIAAGVNASARGMAPAASLFTFRFDNDEAEMAALAGEQGQQVLISNHSYGTVTGWTSAGGAWRWVGNPAISTSEDHHFGLYTSKAQLLDEIASQAPFYTICWAAGNDRGEPGDGTRPPDCNAGTGYDCIIPDAVAKNSITVGAIDPLPAYTNPASVVMSSYSSWGPTDDGRIKPDLVGVGTNVFSLAAAPPEGYTVLSGTSMATPNVSGSLLLLQELHKKLSGGRPMRAATLKALAVHTAREAGDFPGPDYRFGWGLLDVRAAAAVLVQRDGINAFVEENTLRSGETWTLNLNPQAGRKITITLAWTDPAGAPAPDQLDPPDLALVNDLDLRLVDDQGIAHLPWILNPASPADRATRGDNFRDNIEKIELELPVSRPYQIRLSHKGTLRHGRQEYSILVTYAAVSGARTLYWIGDEGNWSDATKWSLSSGGPPAFTVPAFNDRVIFDENSFQNQDGNAVQLTAPVSVRGLLWLTGKPAGIEFNQFPLTISAELKFASRSFRSAGGLIQFSNSTSALCSVDFFDLHAPRVQLRFSGGNWRLRGVAKLLSLETTASSVGVLASRLHVEYWQGNFTQAVQWNFADSEIRVSKEVRFANANRIAANSSNTTLYVKGDTRFEASDLNWPVVIALDSGTLTMAGTGNHFRAVQSNGSVTISGSNRFDRLQAESGTLTLPGGARQVVSVLQLNNGTVLQGTGASIELPEYRKFCFEQLQISGVSLVGNGVVSVGLASTLVTAPGWQAATCAGTLFADFSIRYPCQSGNTMFISTASGNPENFSWQFQQGSVSGTASGMSSGFQFAARGEARVRFMVSRGASAHQRDSVIHIQPNSLAENQILATSDRLTSFVAAERYEWYLNQQMLAGQNERFIIHNGEPGAYRVLAFQGPCNQWSPVYTVTGRTEAKPEVLVYPNPAAERIFVQSAEAVTQVIIYDSTGRRLQSSSGPGANVANLPAGLYVCDVHTASTQLRTKFLVQR